MGGKDAIRSARDFHGHGTHTLSIAGGNFVYASVLGMRMGMTSGGLLKARVAAYKVSGYDPEILSAFVPSPIELMLYQSCIILDLVMNL
ncbi:subtilisin-like protease-like protein [Trifolium pratense]|uniref:Subtilisin-like protease-like protein n=1 Tax=Trifolium pratense TaxID=57577 RepID=A0A2K3KRI5_TRIPR|nr:subtilisin-like protease-like protein [Trifolium pratense]